MTYRRLREALARLTDDELDLEAAVEIPADREDQPSVFRDIVNLDEDADGVTLRAGSDQWTL